MLPGEADAAEDLDAALGRFHVGVEGDGPGQHGRQAGLVSVGAVGGPGRVPGQRRGLLDGDEHVGQPVLDGLELPDGPAELTAVLGVLGGRLETPPRPAGALGGGDGEGPLAHQTGGHPAQTGPGGDDRAGHPYGGHPPAEVQTGQRLHRDTGRVEAQRAPDRLPRPVLDMGGDQEQLGAGAGAQHRSDRPGEGQAAVVSDRGRQGAAAGQGHGGGQAPVDQGGQEFLGVGRIRGTGEHGRRQHGGQDRSGGRRARQLLHHHGQLHETEALAAVLLGHVNAQPALAGQLVPEGRQGFGVGVEHGPGDFRWTPGLDPPAQRAPQLLVVFPDPDRHPCSTSSRAPDTPMPPGAGGGAPGPDRGECRRNWNKLRRRDGHGPARRPVPAARRQGCPRPDGDRTRPVVGAAGVRKCRSGGRSTRSARRAGRG